MGRLVVLGEAVRVDGYAMAGATVIPAEDPASVRAAWAGLPADTSIVVVTARADDVLRGAGLVPARGDALVVVMPA